jgi:hypothetical protein
MEAELSEDSNQEISTDEEGDGLDHDLSGFIANESFESQNESVETLQAIYRKSLLSPEMVIPQKAYFKTPKAIEMTQMQYRDSDTPGSLASFIVGDDEIEYENSSELTSPASGESSSSRLIQTSGSDKPGKSLQEEFTNASKTENPMDQLQDLLEWEEDDLNF